VDAIKAFYIQLFKMYILRYRATIYLANSKKNVTLKQMKTNNNLTSYYVKRLSNESK